VSAWGVPDWRDASAYPSELRPAEWAWQFLRRNPEYRLWWHEEVEVCMAPDGTIDQLDFEGLRKFRLILPRCPSKADGVARFSALAVHSWRGSARGLGRDEVAIVYDLSLPLERQVERAHLGLRELQAHRVRKKQISAPGARCREERYSDYLRLIDAEDAGSPPEITAAALFPALPNDYPDYRQRKTYRNHRAAALGLRDGGYKKLVKDK
jgi:hypothetical protein